MRFFSKACATLVLAIAPMAAHAGPQADTEEMYKALAAGYKALATCSAVFVAEQDRAEIDANELDGVYTDYEPYMSDVSDANIDERQRVVSVRFDFDRPPRLAVHRLGMGCALLPVGAKPSATDWLQTYAGLKPDQSRDVSTALGDRVMLTTNTIALDRLNAPISFAFDGQTYGEGTRTSAVVLVHKGEVIAEQYARGIDADTPQRTWSVAKSLTSTVLGAAMQQGLIGLDNEALIAAFNRGGDPRRSITMRNALNMVSGLESGDSGSRTDRIYFGGVAAADMLPARALEAAPGSRFKYSNYDTLLAMRYLREALNDDPTYHRFPYDAVLNVIGARSTTLETDWLGDFVSSSQVWMTARDMARMGQLYLQDGQWGGNQILHPDWIEFVRTPGPDQPVGTELRYGGGFWLMGHLQGIPENTIAALGSRGQLMVVVPQYELVIVRRGFDPSGGNRFDTVAFTQDIVAVMERLENERLQEEATRLLRAREEEQ
ncbi:MAG: serine hydrolase [Pseudomonadota bacterium]